MLQQDESKIGELDNLLLLSDGKMVQLIEAFQSFYPDSVVEPVQSVLEEHGVRIPRQLKAAACVPVQSSRLGR